MTTTLYDAFNDLNKLDCFGYLPTSSSTKPAHIANGWFRCVLGKRYDPALLNQTVVHWTQNGEVNPSERILADHPSVFDSFQQVTRRRDFAEFRSDLRMLVSPAGGAVNKGNRHSSYNITCERHLTEDYNDRSVGAFLYHLIATDLGKGRSPAYDLLCEILRNPRDEVTAVTAPLIAGAESADVAMGSYAADSVFRKRSGQFVSRTLQQLRLGFDNLAAFEHSYGGGLDALRRMVAFGVFAVLLHMKNRRAELAGETASPLLVYFAERQRTTAYQASHYTYNLVRQGLEQLYTDCFRAWLEPRVGTRPSAKKCEQFVAEAEFGRENDRRRAQLLRTYRSFATQMGGRDALAEALRECIFRELSGTPIDFYRSLGVRIGILRPAGNSAVRKYYTLEGVLLEAVLASILPSGQITFRELLDELFLRYGLVSGGRNDDVEILMRAGIGHATVQYLKVNASVFRQQLLSLGWARQFADGVLVVQVPEGLR